LNNFWPFQLQSVGKQLHSQKNPNRYYMFLQLHSCGLPVRRISMSAPCFPDCLAGSAWRPSHGHWPSFRCRRIGW